MSSAGRHQRGLRDGVAQRRRPRLRRRPWGGPSDAPRGGDDLLQLELETAFAGSAYLSGGAGTADALADDGTTQFATPPTILHFEQ